MARQGTAVVARGAERSCFAAMDQMTRAGEERVLQREAMMILCVCVYVLVYTRERVQTHGHVYYVRVLVYTRARMQTYGHVASR